MRNHLRRKPRASKSIRKNCLPLELERLETRWLPAVDLRDSLAVALAPPDAGTPFDDLEADLFAVDRHHRPEGGGTAGDAMHHSPGVSDGSSGSPSPTGGRQATGDPNAAAEMNAWQN